MCSAFGLFSCGLCWSYILTHVILSHNDNKVRGIRLAPKFEGLPIKQLQGKRNVLRNSRFLHGFGRLLAKCTKKLKVTTLQAGDGKEEEEKVHPVIPGGTALTQGLTDEGSQELYCSKIHCLKHWLDLLWRYMYWVQHICNLIWSLRTWPVKGRDTETNKKSNKIIFPYIQSFCTPQNSCQDKPPCVNHKDKKKKKDNQGCHKLPHWPTDPIITWEK